MYNSVSSFSGATTPPQPSPSGEGVLIVSWLWVYCVVYYN